MSGDPATKRDLEQAESRLEQKLDAVESRLEQMIDIVARQGASLTERDVSHPRRDVGHPRRPPSSPARAEARYRRQASGLAHRGDASHPRRDVAIRADMVALREDVGREIAWHMQAGFEMMRQLFATQDDRTSIEDRHSVLHRDFTGHALDSVLHDKR